jgi:hypothetical protein
LGAFFVHQPDVLRDQGGTAAATAAHVILGGRAHTHMAYGRDGTVNNTENAKGGKTALGWCASGDRSVLGHERDQIDHAVAVAKLVVVPTTV